MNKWEADPEKYNRLAKPIETVAHAEIIAETFCKAIAHLREQYHIPELIISYQMNVMHEGNVVVMHGSAGWGNQLIQADLAKKSFDSEFTHLMKVLHSALEAYPDIRDDHLLTDPSGLVNKQFQNEGTPE